LQYNNGERTGTGKYEQRNLFNGKELQDELAINWYDYSARMYDPALGRTTSQDPHSLLYPGISPYSFLWNDPINSLDPTGMDAIDVNVVKDETVNNENNENISSGLSLSNSSSQSGVNDVAICPTCPNTPKFQPYIDDPDKVYEYNPKTGKVSPLEMLPGVTVTAKRSEPVSAMDLIISIPQTGPLFKIGAGIGAGIGTAISLTVALVFTPAAGAGEGEMEALQKMQDDYLKGGKQGKRDRTYGLPKELFDWYHNGGGKEANGDMDIGHEPGELDPDDARDQWEGLGKPGGSKPPGWKNR
jgi:RHS repeat-associated protein